MSKLRLRKGVGIALIILFFFFLIFLSWRIASYQKRDEGRNIETSQNAPVPVKQGELAPGFPDIPLNKKTIIIDSYALRDKDIKSVTEASVVFESSVSAGENNVFYEKWARDYNWQISAAKKDSFHLSKENETVSIALSSVSDKKTEISILYRKTLPKEIDKKLRDSFKNLKF